MKNKLLNSFRNTVRYLSFGSVFILLLVVSCKREPEKKQDTTTSGVLSISVDETLLPIVQAQADIFMHRYPKATVILRYRTESECIQDLYTDSSQLVVLGKKLSDSEFESFKKISFNPLQLQVATDAMALIVHKETQDTALTYARVLDILKGNDKKTNIVFDNAGSGTVSYILALTGTSAMPPNAFAAKSNAEVVNYVSQNKNALGIIGWSWLSDSDDPRTQDYLRRIRLVSIGKKTTPSDFYKPYQQNLMDSNYVLSRPVYVIQRERRSGLAAGFTTFLYGDIGQTIFNKAGLLPNNQFERWIEFSTKSVNKSY
jgi:phosphate transport system substrate-binding protein